MYAQNPKVKPGIEVLRDNNFDLLKGKKVGLITNPTGVDTKLKSTVDILHESKNVDLEALFGPEHGVRGAYAAGEYVEYYVDEKTDVPVYSLYGKTRKPSDEMLEGLDVLVYDIQDNGCRSYTYISTMGLAMEAAAENDLEFVVLDRPNPLGGERVEGNLVEEGYISFVSQFKIPYVYGLTCGELAKMLNNEGMLTDGKSCELEVVPMEGWERDMPFQETGLEWVPTSPHLPHKFSPYYYVTTGIAGELRSVSIGVGYTLPFQTFAAEWIEPGKFADEMNKLNLKGVHFRPVSYKPFYSVGEGTELHGTQIHITDFNKVNLMEIQFYLMQVNNELYPDKDLFELANDNRFGMFDKVTGTDRIRKKFSKDFDFSDIEPILNEGVKEFKKLSEKYYLYD
jgi:uncharacterized protein YbbC (DUF1343 family)